MKYEWLVTQKNLYEVCKAAAHMGLMPADCKDKNIAQGLTQVLCNEWYCVIVDGTDSWFYTKEEAVQFADDSFNNSDEDSMPIIYVEGPNFYYQPIVAKLRRDNPMIPGGYILVEKPYPVYNEGGLLFEAHGVIDNNADQEYMDAVLIQWMVTKHDDPKEYGFEAFYDINKPAGVFREGYYNAVDKIYFEEGNNND